MKAIGLLLILAVVVVAVYLTMLAIQVLRRSRDVNPARRDVTFENHQQMARWIDKALADDMVEPLLPADTREEARVLLTRFYGPAPRPRKLNRRNP